MADHVIHISEAEAASNFADVLARVRAGAEVVIESGKVPVAVLRPVGDGVPAPPALRIHRSGEEARRRAGLRAYARS